MTVVGLGQAAVGYFGLVSRYPDLESRRQLRQFSIQGGGPVATALATLATLGVETTFLGKVSDDDFGRHALRSLASLGVDVAHAVIAPGCVSPFSFVAVDEGQAQETVHFTPGSVPPLTPDELVPAALDRARMLLLDGCQPAAQIAAAERVRARGVPVVLSASSAQEGTGDLLALADTLICSERFATEVAPRGELEDCLRELRQLGPRTVVITLGAAGAVGLEDDRVVRPPTFAVQTVDTVGAGEVFHGAYAYGALESWTLERRVHFAVVAASLSCRALGRRAALPDLAEILLACGWRP